MKSAEILSKTDRTSWSRIMMVAAYFWPRYKVFCLIVPLFSAAITFYALNVHEPWLKQLMMSMLSLLVILAPIKLAKRPDSDFTYTLPALGWEKCAVLFGLFFIIIPLLLIVPSEIVGALTHNASETAEKISPYNSLSFEIVGWTVVYAALASCLWGVMSTGRNRTAKGVIASMVCLIGLTVVIAFVIGFFDGYLGHSQDFSETSVVVQGIISFIVFIIFLIKSENAISRRQI